MKNLYTKHIKKNSPLSFTERTPYSAESKLPKWPRPDGKAKGVFRPRWRGAIVTKPRIRHEWGLWRMHCCSGACILAALAVELLVCGIHSHTLECYALTHELFVKLEHA